MAVPQPTEFVPRHIVEQPAQHQRPEEPITIPADRDGVAYLYGHPLLNSLSPLLHQTVYDGLGLNWTQIPLSSVYGTSATYPPPYTRSPPVEKFLASIKANPKFVGSSVTMPWKVSIMPHLDDLTEDAKQAGACNTIYIREKNGRKEYVGTNTDVVGVREAILQNKPQLPNGEDPFRNKPALIIGGGGTARTAIYVMRKWLGSSKIYIVNRDTAEVQTILAEDKHRAPEYTKIPLIHVTDPAEAAKLEAPAVIVSGIPNYPPKTPEEINAREVAKVLFGAPPAPGSGPKGTILEMCYHPVPWTQIAELASSAGWKVILGSEALLWQGLGQAQLWTGKDLSTVPGLIEKTKEAVFGAVREKAAAAASKI